MKRASPFAPFLAAVALLFAFPPSSFAQVPPPFRWGMDEAGGAPYVFDNRTRGFEVELAEYIAGKLGRTSAPVSNEWNKLPELLERGDIDVVLNGYEFSQQFRPQASVPYYIYRLSLVVNASSSDIQSWDDLRAKNGKPGKRVGVLTGSAASRYMAKTFGDSISVQVFEDVANTYDLVATGQLDATVQDNAAAVYYVPADKQRRLKLLPEPRTQGYYVILTRPEDAGLRRQVDDAVKAAAADGTLERIYRKYGIWNPDQERLLYRAGKEWTDDDLPDEQETAAGEIDWPLALKLLLMAAGTTIVLAVAAMPLATLLGLFAAALRLYGPRWFGGLIGVYVEVLRGTPLLLQLWVLFYLLPRVFPVFAQLDPILIGILGLALNYSASEAEHFRGAFLNLPRGQMEAALALGLSPRTAVRRILAPQAVRAAIPSVTNDFVALFKDTAVCSVIAVMELTKQYNTLYNNHRDHILALAAITACLYLLMSYPLSLAARHLERRVGSAGGRA